MSVFGERKLLPSSQSSHELYDQRLSLIQQTLLDVDRVPTYKEKHACFSDLVIWEDNEAVIKMTIKGRSTAMRHLSRTHRVNLDWLYEALFLIPIFA